MPSSSLIILYIPASVLEILARAALLVRHSGNLHKQQNMLSNPLSFFFVHSIPGPPLSAYR